MKGQDLTVSTRPPLSIVVPFYNEGPMVESTVAALGHADGEIIFVDDGSSDDTRQRLIEATRNNPNVRVIAHDVNRGASAALLTGLYAATGDAIVVLDADLSYGPEHIDLLVGALKSQYAAIAVASPYHLDGIVDNVPATRLALSVAANRLFRSITGSHVATYTGMVRAYNRRFLQTVDSQTLTGDINCALILAALARGERVVEVPSRLAWPNERRSQARFSARSLMRRTGEVLASLRHAPLPKVPFSPTPMLPMDFSAPRYASNATLNEDRNS